MTKPSDRELIQAVIAGEKAAFAELYDRYGPLVRAISYDTTRNLTDAQDLAQDVFMRAYEKLGRLRNPDRFGRWIVGIARFRCREWRRHRSQSRDKHSGLEDTKLAITNQSNDGQIEQLREMITKLPEKERLALHTFYLQGESSENAHRIVGLSRSGFYRLLERARKRLALHTFYLQSKSAENARRIMGLSRSGFYRLLDRARKRLEYLLVKEREDIR